MNSIKEALLKIYYFTIINITSRRIASKSDWVISKLTTEKSKKYKKYKILFNYFNTIDCQSLHEGVISKLINNNHKTLKFKSSQLSVTKYIKYDQKKKDVTISKSNSFLTIKKQCIRFKIPELYYPIIDTIIIDQQIINYNFLNFNFTIDNFFFKKIFLLKKKIYNLSKKFDCLVLADRAYLDNHLLKQTFIKLNKPVYYLMTNGLFFEAKKNIYDDEFSSKDNNNLKIYKENKSNILQYLKNRFLGKLKNDIDNDAYKSSKKNRFYKKKILFLHNFLDASNNTWNRNQIFHSNLEWADFTLKELSKQNFENWYIKIHPTDKYFPGNEKIFNYFKKKYKIPEDAYKNCPNTLTILKNKMPIYSNQGTIILESIIFGYKTYFSGAKYKNYFGIKSKSKNDWLKFLNKRLDTKKNRNVSENLKKIASAIIWSENSIRNIKNLCPTAPIRRWSSISARAFAGINQFFQTFKKYKQFDINIYQ